MPSSADFWLADKFGRKFIFTYNLLVYMTGVMIIMLSCNFPMLLAGFLVTGISVGIGVPASWTYISESSEIHNRGRNICISQMSWGLGPMFILFFGMLLAPGGLLYAPVESLAHAFLGEDARVVFLTLFIVAFIAWTLQRQLEESAEFTAQKSSEKSSSIVDNIKLLFTNKIAVKTVAFLAVIYLTWNLVASVMGFFMPHIYETAGGLSNETANMLSCVSWVFVVVTTFIISFFVDKVAHRFLPSPRGFSSSVAAYRPSVASGSSQYSGVSTMVVPYRCSMHYGVQSCFPPSSVPVPRD